MKLSITQKQINFAYNSLLDKSRLDFGFVLMAVISMSICVFGFAINSPSVIIGSMLVSPLLYPLLSIPATLFWKDYKIFKIKTAWIIISIMVLIIYAMLISSILEIFSLNNYGSELFVRLEGHLIIYFLVAIASGAGGAVSLFWPHVFEAIPGVAISVALLPPIVILGYSLTIMNFDNLYISSLILLLNFVGIILGSALIIYIFRKYKK